MAKVAGLHLWEVEFEGRESKANVLTSTRSLSEVVKAIRVIQKHGQPSVKHGVVTFNALFVGCEVWALRYCGTIDAAPKS